MSEHVYQPQSEGCVVCGRGPDEHATSPEKAEAWRAEAEKVLRKLGDFGGPRDGVAPAYHDMNSDIVVVTDDTRPHLSGFCLTVGDVRAARELTGGVAAGDGHAVKREVADLHQEIATLVADCAALRVALERLDQGLRDAGTGPYCEGEDSACDIISDVLTATDSGKRLLEEHAAALAAKDVKIAALHQQSGAALATAMQSGGVDGSHHKAWVIDQMVRTLAGDNYAAWVHEHNHGVDGETYEWDEGTPP